MVTEEAYVCPKEPCSSCPIGTSRDLEIARHCPRIHYARLRAMIESTGVMMAYLDHDFRFVIVNETYAHGAGYSRDDLIGRGHFELFPHAENEAIFRHVSQSGEPASFSARPFMHPQRADDPISFWDWTLTPVQDPLGSEPGFVFTLREVTDQVITREALYRADMSWQALHEMDQAILAASKASEIAQIGVQWLRRLLSLNHASVAVLDDRRRYLQLLAVDADDTADLVLGTRLDVRDVVWPEDLAPDVLPVRELQPSCIGAVYGPSVSHGLQFALRAQNQLMGILNLGVNDPGDLSREDKLFAHRVGHQIAIGVQQARLDEAVRYHAYQLERTVAERTRALRASEARLRAIVEQAPLGICVIGQDGRFGQVNRRFCDMFDWDEAEVGFHGLDELLEGDDAHSYEAIQRVWRGESPSVRLDHGYPTADGGTRWLECTFALIDGDSPSRQMMVMVDDVTDRIEAQKALVASYQMAAMGQLAATFTHEINNPLQAVVGCLGLANDMVAADSEVAPYLGVARDELLRATRLVRRLRDLAHPLDGGEAEPVDLDEILQDIATLQANHADENGIALDLRLGGDAMVEGVPDQLRQAMLNLVMNAMEAMPDGGRLTLATRRETEPKGIAVLVADTGSGMSAEVQDHLFELFHTTKPEGLGIGLHITRQLIREHGGQISVESREGEGTTFHVWLPLNQTPA